MHVPRAGGIRREVAPLELLFDLVFVLAIGQLAHHLIEHLTWRAGVETLAMLVAVCGVWAFTSFEVTLLDIERGGTKAVTVAVMGLGLFMNAGIAHAFETGSWLFAIPMVLALVGGGVYAAATSPTPQLREHFVRVLAWTGASAPLWIAGAALGPDARIWFWSAAALVDLAGTWTAHPTPGRTTRTARLPFDAEHMLERMRLFLIILLGETVLTLGRAISDHYSDALTLVLALGGFAAVVFLWQVYFGRSEQQVVRHTSATEDPIRSVHVGINAIYGVVAGLVVLASGLEIVLAHAHEGRSGAAGALVLAGPMVYLASQAVYFRIETGTGWRPRTIGAAVLGLAAVAAYWLPGYLVVALLVVILAGLAVHLSREEGAGTAVE